MVYQKEKRIEVLPKEQPLCSGKNSLFVDCLLCIENKHLKGELVSIDGFNCSLSCSLFAILVAHAPRVISQFGIQFHTNV